VRPTRAEGTMLGRRLGHKPTLARVGYLPEHHRFPRYLTGRQALDFYAALARVDRPTRRRRADELLEVVGMKEWARARIGSYSKGMMQRIGLAQSLMNDPALIMLDEPTDGVDPMGRREIRDVLLRLREQGKTMFLNSHLLSELEMVCDRVAILVQGVVAMQGTLDELTVDSQRFEITIEGPEPEWTAPMDGLRIVPERDGLTKLVLRGSDPRPAQLLIDRLRSQQRVIRSAGPVRETLEDLFMRAVTDPRTGAVRSIGAGGRS